MKKWVLLILLIPLAVWAVDGPLNIEHPAEVIGVSEPDEIIGVTGLADAGSDCPAWGTYGTSTGNITFAWSGGHSSGQEWACDETESGLDATTYDITFSGTGDATYIIIDASGESIEWAVDETNVDLGSGSGWTAWFRVRFEADTNSTTFFEVQTADNGVDSLSGEIASSTSYTYANLYADSTGYSQYSNGGMSTSTWYNVALTWEHGRATNDICWSDDDGSSWSCAEKNWGDWTETVNAFLVGMDAWVTYNVEVRVDSVAIVKGWQQASPW